ncbi:hypothetical protein K9N68_02075 [Kovacikia minuta CCNUW1]|uniref:hypothetical protein n=1 Tax=Kovacikia minuta TaxID=2931930 RepID=UPI001CCDE74C|nr:hypothetical protein [Kovacikia minuta]UBF26805.1 hypothetical protein K9N68_02075 [Kovacikia minuta CCNUW1]
MMPKNKKEKLFGKQPPRHNFFLNPYTDARFTSCPRCNAKTKQRKLPLFIFVSPVVPIILNKTCRYCPACDLLIAHKNQLDELLATVFTQMRQPAMIGNDYFVVGTVDRATWREGKSVKHIDEIRAIVHDFKKTLDFEPQRYEWVKEP